MSVDYLRQLVEDFDNGTVDLEGTLNRLEFLDWSENKKVLPQDYIKVPRDPLSIFLEHERSEQLQDALLVLKDVLSADNWKILVWVSKGLSYEAIGRKLGISRQAVYGHLETIRRHAPNLNNLLRKDTPIYEADHTKVHIGYPVERAMTGKCTVPEYLDERFKDCSTICCYCENCKCKSNKERL